MVSTLELLLALVTIGEVAFLGELFPALIVISAVFAPERPLPESLIPAVVSPEKAALKPSTHL